MTKDLTSGSPLKVILMFTFPLVLGNLFQQFYALADTIIVGRFCGVSALASVGATGSVNYLILGFVIGVCNGFAIPIAQLFGVFGEGVDLTGESLIGVAVVSPGLPQIGPRQEQLRDYFEETRGAGFDYAYRYPGMNKVLQAAGRVIRTPQDRGVVLLIDDRFLAPDTRRLMPPHWEHLRVVDSADAWKDELAAFWKKHEP